MIFLVADDDLDDHELFRETAMGIVGDNCSIIQLWNGKEVLEYVTSSGNYSDEATVTPDVIILDLNMPKLNGIEALKQLKNNPTFSKIPVYILTTSWEDSYMKQCQALGARGYFTKPSEVRILKTIIKQIVAEVERGL